MPDVPILQIPLPGGVSRPALVQRVWTEYARVADPTVSAATEADWYRLHYVGLMNDGPLRGRAILLPQMRQEGTALHIRKASFADITRAQIEVGMREVPVEFDSTAALAGTEAPTEPPAEAATETPPAVAPPPSTPPPTPPPPAPQPAPTPPPPAPAPADTPPAEPPTPVVPPADAKPLELPPIEPVPPAEPVPLEPEIIQPDSTPKP
jgi:hypothetical protein